MRRGAAAFMPRRVSRYQMPDNMLHCDVSLETIERCHSSHPHSELGDVEFLGSLERLNAIYP
jgi:hypothetical protein